MCSHWVPWHHAVFHLAPFYLTFIGYLLVLFEWRAYDEAYALTLLVIVDGISISLHFHGVNSIANRAVGPASVLIQTALMVWAWFRYGGGKSLRKRLGALVSSALTSVNAAAFRRQVESSA